MAARSAAWRWSCTSRTRRCASCWRRISTDWIGAIEDCLDAAGEPPAAPTLDRRALAEFVLTTMEGGVMQARTHRDVGYFDRAVGQLRSISTACCSRRERRPAAGHNAGRRGSHMPEVNWLAVLAAAISAFVLGGLWYSPVLFLKAWQRGTGLDRRAAAERRASGQ